MPDPIVAVIARYGDRASSKSTPLSEYSMSTRVIGPITKVIPIQTNTNTFVPFTGWLQSAGIKEAWWQGYLRDPTTSKFNFKPAYQVAYIDAHDPSDVGTAVTKDFVWGPTSGVESGYGVLEGGYLSEWEDVQGVNTGATRNTDGTSNSFWVRFGVVVRDNNATSAFERGEVTMTIATRE